MIVLDTKGTPLTKMIDRKYGEAPRRPEHLTVNVIEEKGGTLPGATVERRLDFCLEYPKSTARIPAYSVLSGDVNAPVVVAIGSYPTLPCSPIPVRELIARGFGILYIPAESVSSLRGELRESADRVILPSRRGNYTAGKISLYAFALCLAREYLSKLGYSRLVSFGHCPTAEAALLAAVRDDGFSLAMADSPFLTVRTAPFLPESFYSIGFVRDSYLPNVNLFEGIAPRGVILGLSDSSVPDESELILDMLSESYGTGEAEKNAFLSSGCSRIFGHEYGVFGYSGAPLLYPEMLLCYLDAVSAYFVDTAEREPITV